MAINTITKDQAQHFLDHGFIHLTDCFDPGFAANWVQQAYLRLGVSCQDPISWESPLVHMPANEFLSAPLFAPKVWSAICDLLGGEERVKQPLKWGNNFIVNFSLGADENDPKQTPYRQIDPNNYGWHKDGDFFWHFLDSPEQALLCIVVWKDIEPNGGGTLLALDSIKAVAQHLMAHPEGLHPFEGGFGKLISECKEFYELTGKAGDVFLIHPFMLHSSSPNRSGSPRFITNPVVSLREPMDFCRKDGSNFSLVETSILKALGKKSLNFVPQSKRRPFDHSAYNYLQEYWSEEYQKLKNKPYLSYSL